MAEDQRQVMRQLGCDRFVDAGATQPRFSQNQLGQVNHEVVAGCRMPLISYPY
jgi:hypothetical protein